MSWRLSRLVLPRLRWLNALGGWLTLSDSFGTPGDTICTGTLAREIKKRFPRVRINCITPNPDLLVLDPAIDRLNGPPTTTVLRYWYLDIIQRKDGATNLLSPTLKLVGISDYQYDARVYLSQEELEDGRQRVLQLKRPIVTLNVQSREKVKVWPIDRWLELAKALAVDYDLVQLGAGDEPELPSAVRLAGLLNMRESLAVLAQANLHVGGVSFLMHGANGLDVPSVIIYGGRETPQNSGYEVNTNLYAKTPCSPCWLHDSHGDVCPYAIACMDQITVDQVERAVRERLRSIG